MIPFVFLRSHMRNLDIMITFCKTTNHIHMWHAMFVVFFIIPLSFGIADAAPHEEWQTTPLFDAALRGDIPAMKALIKQGAKPTEGNVYGNTPLHYALLRTSMERRQGRAKVVAFLVSQGANVNAKNGTGVTPLMEAVNIGDTGAAKFLLAHGAIVDLKDSKGTTALSIASGRLYGDIVELLLLNEANVNGSHDENGRTPLLSAIAAVATNTGTTISPDHSIDEAQRLLIVNLLLKHKAEVNTVDHSGWSALALASDQGLDNIAKLLISHGADVNVRVPNMGHGTPLIMAVRRDSVATMKAILLGKPDLFTVDDFGRTALSYARGYRDQEMINLLQQAGATK
jgi:ankyrin repeat protein